MCWNEVKVAVLCAHQYMPWSLIIIKVLNNFWHFEHYIPTRTCSEAYLSHYWSKCREKLYSFYLLQRQFLQSCFKYGSKQIIVKIRCSKYQTLFKTLIKNTFQDMHCCAHKTANLTSIQHTVPSLPPIFGWCSVPSVSVWWPYFCQPLFNYISTCLYVNVGLLSQNTECTNYVIT